MVRLINNGEYDKAKSATFITQQYLAKIGLGASIVEYSMDPIVRSLRTALMLSKPRVINVSTSQYTGIAEKIVDKIVSGA